MILDVSLNDIKRVMTGKGYEIFSSLGVPNIVGIRNSISQSNTYDDVCWVWWNESGIEIKHNYTITTHPGYYYLLHPIKGTNGTAILVPGQYKNCWSLGMHRNTQFALCERNGPVKVYRDDNKDTILDMDASTIQSGYFGIDLHAAGVADSDIVDHYSAGCQVWRYHIPHANLMKEFDRLSKTYKFKTFSYTLLNYSDFSTS